MKKAAGINVNVYAGIGMLVIAASFGTWALLKPLEAPARSDGEDLDRRRPAAAEQA